MKLALTRFTSFSEELSESADWDFVEQSIQIDVICTRHDQKLLGFGRHLIKVL